MIQPALIMAGVLAFLFSCWSVHQETRAVGPAMELLGSGSSLLALAFLREQVEDVATSSGLFCSWSLFWIALALASGLRPGRMVPADVRRRWQREYDAPKADAVPPWRYLAVLGLWLGLCVVLHRAHPEMLSF